jgi:succinate dehydrogenase / fumarate reductase flavoprotein subunit
MGGIRVDAETQQSSVPGLFAAGECAAGLHGANRLGGNSLSDLLVFGQRAGEHAASFVRAQGPGSIDESEVEAAIREALAPFERKGQGDNPYRIQSDLQRTMQDLVGIVRTGAEMERALAELSELGARARRVAVPGNREYNPGWHTALDLASMLLVSEVVTRSALERRESRGAHFREDFPAKDEAFARVNVVVHRGPSGEPIVRREPVPSLSDEQRAIVAEMK